MWSNVADCCKLWSKRGQENIEGRLFIFVVSVCGQNIHFYDKLFYFIYQSMFLGDALDHWPALSPERGSGFPVPVLGCS